MRHVTFRAVLACMLIAFAIWLFVAKASRRMPDFEVYWRAGARAAAAEPLYRPSDEDYQLKYFPAFAIAAIPLGMLPLDTAKAVWFALSAIALVALLPLSVTLLPHRRQPMWLLIGVLLIGLGKYYAEDLVLGQINTLVALVAALALLALNRGREAAGGLLVALAIVLKPYALILAPWIAARRQRQSIASAGHWTPRRVRSSGIRLRTGRNRRSLPRLVAHRYDHDRRNAAAFRQRLAGVAVGKTARHRIGGNRPRHRLLDRAADRGGSGVPETNRCRKA